MKKAIKANIDHEKMYFKLLFANRQFQINLLLVLIMVLSLFFSFSLIFSYNIAWAEDGNNIQTNLVESWLLEDAVNTEFFKKEKFHIQENEFENEESKYGEIRFPLNMPMYLEDYIDESLYENIGDDIAWSTNEGAFNHYDFQLWTDEEKELAAEELPDFIEKRPPAVKYEES